VRFAGATGAASSIRTSEMVSMGTPSVDKAQNMITAELTCAPVPAGTGGRGTKKRGLRYGGSEKREGRRFVERKLHRGGEASPLIVGGNGHGSRFDERGEAERAEGAMVVRPGGTCRERGVMPIYGEIVRHRCRFAGGRANGGGFGGARFAYRRLRCGGEDLKDQHSEEDSPDVGSGEHSWDTTSPHPGLAIEFAINSHFPVFRGGRLKPRFFGRPLRLCFMSSRMNIRTVVSRGR